MLSPAGDASAVAEIIKRVVAEAADTLVAGVRLLPHLEGLRRPCSFLACSVSVRSSAQLSKPVNADFFEPSRGHHGPGNPDLWLVRLRRSGRGGNCGTRSGRPHARPKVLNRSEPRVRGPIPQTVRDC